MPGWMDQKGIFVGRTRLEISNNEKQTESLIAKYNGWVLLYANCPNPKKLMALIATLGKYLYEIDRKENAVDTLISTAHELDPESGRELDNLIN